MKLSNIPMFGMVYKKFESEYTKKDGSVGKRYSLAIDLEEQIETFNVSEEIYNSVERLTEYCFGLTYNFPTSEKWQEPLYISSVSPWVKEESDNVSSTSIPGVHAGIAVPIGNEDVLECSVKPVEDVKGKKAKA